MQQDRKLFIRLNEWVSVCVCVCVYTFRYPADTKILSSQFICACFVSLAFVSISFAYLYHIYLSAFGLRRFVFQAKQLGKLFRYVCAFSLFFFFYHRAVKRSRSKNRILRQIAQLQHDLKVLKINKGTIKTIYSYTTCWAIQPNERSQRRRIYSGRQSTSMPAIQIVSADIEWFDVGNFFQQETEKSEHRFSFYRLPLTNFPQKIPISNAAIRWNKSQTREWVMGRMRILDWNGKMVIENEQILCFGTFQQRVFCTIHKSIWCFYYDARLFRYFEPHQIYDLHSIFY